MERDPMRGRRVERRAMTSSRFFLASADIEDWESLLPMGIFHGVTTNPSILEKANVPCTLDSVQNLAETALSFTDEFMCQAWGGTADELFETGMELSAPDWERIVVSCPVTREGTLAASRLVSKGVRVCLTACYNKKQALIAGGIGAEYIAPYLGRMTDAGKDGMEECLAMQNIVKGLDCDTRILVASLRNVEDMATLASKGMDTFTFSPDVARALWEEPLTEEAAAEFEQAAIRGMQGGANEEDEDQGGFEDEGGFM